MSYDIVRNIYIKGKKVFITSRPNNVHPAVYRRYECEGFSETYRSGGLPALLREISKEVWHGNFHLRPDSELTERLMVSHFMLTRNADLRHFLDADRAAEWMAATVLHQIDKEHYPDRPELAPLDALRYDKDAVLSVCEKNAEAFLYAAAELQQDRDAAERYIDLCGDMLMFRFPEHFKDDKDLALKALEKNGTVFRALGSELQADKDIIRNAFDANRGRNFYEHLPDLIPEHIRKDAAFMRELILMCPKLHVHRTKDILQNKETAFCWIQNGEYVLNHLECIPKEFLASREFQSLLLNDLPDEKALSQLQAKYISMGIVPPGKYKVPEPDVHSDPYQKAYCLNDGEQYFSIQTCEEGYDYSIYHSDFSLYDGGQLDEPQFTMGQAISAILTSFGMETMRRTRCDYDALMEITDIVEAEHLNHARAAIAVKRAGEGKKSSLDEQIRSAEGEKTKQQAEDSLAGKARAISDQEITH